MPKTAYQLTPVGFYAGETVADESPLEPGVFHLPAGCTFTPPPADIPADKWPRWNGSVWTLTQRPAQDDPQGAVAKLAAFLAANPDVAAMLDTQGSSWAA